MAEANIELNRDIHENDGHFSVYQIMFLKDDEFNDIKNSKIYMNAAKMTFDIASWKDIAPENRLMRIATRKKKEKDDKNHSISELFDAEKILRESITRDGGKNLTKSLKEDLKTGEHFPPSTLEYLAQHEFAAQILAANPDIVEAVKKSFNVCHVGFASEYDHNKSKSFTIYEVSEERLQKRAEELSKIADSEVFKPYFDAHKLIEESKNMSEDDKWAQMLLASGSRMSLDEFEEVFDKLAKVLPTHPELYPLVASSLDIKRSDYNPDWHWDDDFERGKSRAQEFIESGKLPYDCYFAIKKKDKIAYAEFKDREEIIKTYLKQENLNIFQLDNCLKLNPTITAEIIRKDEKVRARVEKLFENPRNYRVQTRFADSPVLNQFFNVSSKLDIAEKNLRQMSGNEVFDILTQKESDIPEAREAAMQMDALLRYFRQTKGLSEYGPDADLCYSGYNKDGRWKELNPLLEQVGTYKCAPAVTEVIEERIARIFAHHNYHGKPRSEASYSYMSDAGIAHFADKMVEVVGKNPDSPAAKFYVKHAQYVLDQWDRGNYSYSRMAKSLLPQLAKQGKMDIYDKILTDMVTAPSKYSHTSGFARENFLAALEEDTKSPAVKYYLDNAYKIYDKADDYAEVIGNFITKDKGAHAEIYEKLCEPLFVLAAKRVENGYAFAGDLAKIYQYHKDPRLVDIISKESANIKPEEKHLWDSYARWQRTGLKVFEDHVDKILASVKEVVFKKAIDIDYGPMHEKLKKSHVKRIEFYADNADEKVVKTLLSDLPRLESIKFGGTCSLTPETLAPNPSLKSIEFEKGVTIKDLVGIVSKLPALQTLGVGDRRPEISVAEIKKFEQYLLASKPEKLEVIEFDLSEKTAAALMEKYPTMSVSSEGYSGKLQDMRYRGKKLREIRDGKDKLTSASTLNDVISDKLLAECLQVLPEKKRPSLSALEAANEKLYDNIKKAYGADKYSEVIVQIADVLGEKELKQQAKLREAAKDGKVLEYIKSLPPEERPNVNVFTAKPNAFAKEKDLDEAIRCGVDRDGANLAVIKVIKAMEPTRGDLVEVATDRHCSAELKKAIDTVMEGMQNNARTADMKAVFAKWQAEQGKGK